VRLSQSEGLEIRARGLREEDWHAGGIWSIREGGLRVSGLAASVKVVVVSPILRCQFFVSLRVEIDRADRRPITRLA